MATSRKVPVHKGSGRSSGGAARTAPHPGVSGNGTGGSNFQSPYQPPPGNADLSGDVAALDPNAWHVALAGGTAWRVKVPSASSLGLLAEMATAEGGQRVKVINGFLAAHMHPDDLTAMLLRMTDPDDDFDDASYIELYRAAVTVGTGRPFLPSSPSPAPPPMPGEPFGPSSVWAGYRRR